MCNLWCETSNFEFTIEEEFDILLLNMLKVCCELCLLKIELNIFSSNLSVIIY
jgi:hypothetical protein